MADILIGQKAKDKVSGFEGIVTVYVTFLSSSPRVGLQPPITKDGTLPETQEFDVCQLKITDAKQVIKTVLPPEKFPLGSKVKDDVTGLEGTAVARAIHLNGCPRIAIEPSLDKEGKIRELKFIDEGRVRFKSAPKEMTPKAKTGGPGIPGASNRKIL